MYVHLPHVIILIGILQGFIVATVIFFSKAYRGVVYRLWAFILCIFTLTLTGVFLNGHLTFSSLSLSHRLFISNFPYYCVMALGPLIYLFIRELRGLECLDWKRDQWHFIPVFIDFLPFSISFFANCFYILGWWSEAFTWQMLHFLDAFNIYIDLPKWISLSVYLFFSWKILIAWSDKKSGVYYWAEQSLIGFSIIHFFWTIHFSLYISGLEQQWFQGAYHHPLYYPVVAFVYWASFRVLGNRAILPNKVSYKNSQEEEDLPPDWELIVAEMKNLMLHEKLYLNQNLRLDDVCKALEQSPRLISTLLNQKIDKGFNDFINEYRVEEAKHKLVDRQYANLTIEALAEECGFNSRTTFTRAFKKVTNLSPSDYRKQNGQTIN